MLIGTSIRRRVVFFTSIPVAIFGFVLCSVFYAIAYGIMLNDFERDLAADFRYVAALTKVFPDGEIYVDLDSEIVTSYAPGGTKIYQVWSEDGVEVIDRAVELEAHEIELPPIVFDQKVIGDNKPKTLNTYLPDGRRALAAYGVIDTQWSWVDSVPNLVVDPSLKEIAVGLAVVRDRTDLDQSLRVLLYWILVLVLVLPVLITVVVFFGSRIGLSPLMRLASELEAITSAEQGQRLNSRWPSEIRPVADKLNGLLDRLDLAMKRQQRFTADAAHELRTPLAELQTATDIALRARDNPRRLETAVSQANLISKRLATVVESLLMLARTDGAKTSMVLQNSDIYHLVLQLIEERQVQLDERRLSLVLSGDKNVYVCTHESLLTRVLSNLLANAAEYAPENSVINIEVKQSPFSIRIENSAPDISEDDVINMFSPFWRKGSGYIDEYHQGLGLAIAKEASERLDMTLQVERCSGSLRFTITPNIDAQ